MAHFIHCRVQTVEFGAGRQRGNRRQIPRRQAFQLLNHIIQRLEKLISQHEPNHRQQREGSQHRGTHNTVVNQRSNDTGRGIQPHTAGQQQKERQQRQ